MQKLLRLLLPAAFMLQLLNTGTTQSIPFKLDSMLHRTLDSMHLILNAKGMGAAVQISSGAIWAGGAGVSSENPWVPIDADHVFGIGSVSKTITGACILQLADEGVLSLGDSLHEWLDTFAFVNPNITIRQLLRHQSGIYNYTSNPDFSPLLNTYPDSIWALENIVKAFVKAPIFQPGANWSYSNTNYALLGLIIEKASGNPFYLESRNRFSDPLGLSSVMVPPYEAFSPDVAHVWLDLNGDNIVEDADVFFSNWNAWYSAAGPAGAYFSTPSDMVRWIRAYMSGTLLSPAMMAELKTTVPTPGGTKYGLGIMERNFLGQKAYGHGGDAAYSASVWYFPNKDISIAVLNNDGEKSSLTLIPTVTALLKTYLDFEQQLTDSKELESEISEISAFPNPFSGTLHVSTTLAAGVSDARFVLTNALGEMVAETAHTTLLDGATIFGFDDLSGLPEGVYFLNDIQDGKMGGVRKVVCKVE